MEHKEAAKIMKAMADENRLAILDYLQKEEKCACDILEELEITQPTLSHHMKILVDSGLVDCCKDGKWMHYSLSTEGGRCVREIAAKYSLAEERINGYRKCDACKSCR